MNLNWTTLTYLFLDNFAGDNAGDSFTGDAEGGRGRNFGPGGNALSGNAGASNGGTIVDEAGDGDITNNGSRESYLSSMLGVPLTQSQWRLPTAVHPRVVTQPVAMSGSVPTMLTPLVVTRTPETPRTSMVDRSYNKPTTTVPSPTTTLVSNT